MTASVEYTTGANVDDTSFLAEENTTTKDAEAQETSLPDDKKKEDESSTKPAVGNHDNTEPQQEQRGLFSRIFRRNQQKEPTLVNGAADLLDDERGETTTHDESSVEESSDDVSGDDIDDDNDEEEDHDEASGEGEEEFKGIADDCDDEEEEGEQDEWISDGGEGNAEERDLDDDGDDDDDFGDFAQATKNHDESDEDENEMMSLIGGGDTTTGGRNQNSGKINTLGSSFSKFLGIEPKEEVQKERQSLLDAGNETDDEDNDYQDEDDADDDDNKKFNKDGSRKRGHLQDRSSSADYHDSPYNSDDDEENLQCFYPDSCRQEFPDEPDKQDLYGRIHGFGSESALMRQNSSASSRMFTDTMSDRRMSSMDVEAGDERRGLFNGVGKAVSNITQLILQKRGSADQQSDERRKMLSYIAELEHKLEQKERDLQSWKERAEQLQIEVNWLKENNGEEDDDDDDESDVESGEDQEELEETALIEYQSVDTNEEGILIDITPQAPVFDPLLRTTSNDKADEGILDDDLLDASHYKVAPEASQPLQEDQNNDVLSGESDQSSASSVPKDRPGVHLKTQEETSDSETSNHLVKNKSKDSETKLEADC